MEPTIKKLPYFNFDKIVDIIIRLGILYLLFNWCFAVLRPFVEMIIWGSIIAIAVYPVYSKLVKLFRGRKVIATLCVTLVMLSILVIPSWLITESLITGVNHVREIYREGMPLIPPPGESVKTWPIVAKPIVEFWQLASDNLQAAVLKFKDQLKDIGSVLLNALAGFGKGVLLFLVSILLAGVLLVFSDDIGNSTTKIFQKLAGEGDENFAEITVSTIRSVVKGILGVAVIQAGLAGIGFFVAGVPYAGLWTVLCLVFAIVQVGAGPIAIPITIYMFSTGDTLTATLLAVWMIPVLVSDNILKPLLLGRGAAVPMLVVFLGSIGGFIYIGFLGLFLGAVILSIGYKLFMVWLNDGKKEDEILTTEK